MGRVILPDSLRRDGTPITSPAAFHPAPCKGCGSTLIGQVVGIFFDEKRIPHHIPFDCPGCGTTRGIRREDAPEELRHEAIEVEKSRMAADGLI